MSNIKNKIMDSFKELLNTKQFDKISVKEICNNCNISRPTFYYYFNDIYDIARKIFSETSKKAMTSFTEKDDWSTGYIRMMNWCKTNKNFVYNTYYSKFGQILIDNMQSAFYKDLLILLKTKGKNLKITDEQYTFISNFYSSSLIFITKEWIKNNMQEEPNKIINNLYLLVGEDFNHILIRYDTSNKLKKI